MNFKWDLTKFIKEARAKKSAIAVLRKRSKEYHSFIKTGLDRFENDGNNEEVARDMIKESVSIDIKEIELLCLLKKIKGFGTDAILPKSLSLKLKS